MRNLASKVSEEYGRSSRHVCEQLIKRRAVRLHVNLPPASWPTTAVSMTAPWHASGMTSGRVRRWKTGSARPVHALAVPFDNERLVRAAAFCGYKIGFTTESGVAGLGGDPLQLPRIEQAP